MKRLAVVPTDPITHYINSGYSKEWLRKYFNPAQYFDEVYVFFPRAEDNLDLLGMKVFKTQPEELPERLRQFNIDIVRAYGGRLPCDMVCNHKVDGIPVIVSIHNNNPEGFFRSVRKADFIFCAKQLDNMVRTRFKNEKRIWELPNGISFDTMRPYSREEAQKVIGDRYGIKTKYKILQVGRRNIQKNLETLIRALKYLGNDYSLLTSGKGDAGPYKKIAEEEGVADRIVWVESIKNEEMPYHFAWADCLCHPTRWEGMSLLIVEALASEAIVVASDIPEMIGLIKSGENGLLVKDYEKPQAMAEAVRGACTNRELRAKFRKNARSSVAQFEEGNMRKLEASFYDKILNMKETTSFKTPIWKKAVWDTEDAISRAVPKKFRRFVVGRMRGK